MPLRWFSPLIPLGLALCIICLSSCESNTAQKSYFPLGNGLSYHYRSSFKVNLKSTDQRLIVTNVPARKFEGKTLYPQTFHNGKSLYYELSDQGIFQVARSDDQRKTGITLHKTPLTLLQYPLEKDATWSQLSEPFFLLQKVREINAGQASLSGELTINPLMMEYTISSVNETVHVPAGKYHHCIRIDAIGQTSGSGLEIGPVDITVEQTEWYAPGVGLIKMTRSEVTNLEWARLSHYEQALDRTFQ